MTTELDNILADATNVAKLAAAATGNPIAGAAAVGLGVVGQVAGTIEQSQADHKSAVDTTTAALGTVKTLSPTVIATLPPADQAKATGILAGIESLWAEFTAIF